MRPVRKSIDTAPFDRRQKKAAAITPMKPVIKSAAIKPILTICCRNDPSP